MPDTRTNPDPNLETLRKISKHKLEHTTSWLCGLEGAPASISRTSDHQLARQQLASLSAQEHRQRQQLEAAGCAKRRNCGQAEQQKNSATEGREREHIIKMVATDYLPARWLGAMCLLMLVALVAADGGGQQQQQLDQVAALTGSASEPLAAAASQNSYQQADQQQRQQASKSKKIQIVYIKVPLAKLRPSLNGQHEAYGQANSSGISTKSAGEQQYETTDSKSQGSQQQQFSTADEQQQQFVAAQEVANDGQHQGEGGRRARQPQSFLIPMALVHTGDQAYEPQQQQQVSLADIGGDPAESASFELPRPPQPHSSSLLLGQAGSHLHALHAPNWPHQSQPMAMASGDSAGLGRIRSPAMQTHQLNREQRLALGAPSHGFMSSFLLGEKEKMTLAAVQLQQQHAAAVANFSQGAARHTGQLVPASSSNSNALSPISSTLSSPSSSPIDPKGPGGLMPSIIAPLSRMPDNAIGQAYGAAVGIALPVESGSPMSLLSSPSTSSYGKQQPGPNGYANKTTAGNQQQQQQQTTLSYSGGNAGTSGDAAYSSGTGSSTSYGASGRSPPAGTSSVSGYPSSPSAFAGHAHSSGYGSGTSTSGASAALSDYPGAVSASSSSYNHPSGAVGQQQQQQQSDEYNSRLKQAKKTIIPIVVQVEHAILDNNGQQAGGQAAYPQQQQQQQSRGNKYTGSRGQRQLGGGKRARQQAKGHNNQLYGAATNEIAHYGDIPPGAQWINAANAYDISKITAQINAENAASAAAALAQADQAFRFNGAASYAPPAAGPAQFQGGRGRPAASGGGGQASAYAAGLQSAASALLANTHPMIQAAASGGLASVSKLGAKLGEMMAMPSMQMPGSIANIGQSFPTALSSITNQMGAQFGQAVQQVAKEHPAASAFARQVAQQAGIQLPSFGQQQQLQHSDQQQQMAASSQHMSQMSPQAQLANLKLGLGLGQSLQTAASSLIKFNQKANGASQQASPSSLLGGANQMAFSAALKQLGSISPAAALLASQLAGMQQAAASTLQQTAVAAPPQMVAGAGQLDQAAMQQQQQIYNQLANLQQPSGAGSDTSNSLVETPAASSSKLVKASPSTFKSKFLSYFHAPKFLSNLMSWNDRADDRADSLVELNDLEVSLIEALEAAGGAKNATAQAAAAAAAAAPSQLNSTTSTSVAPPQSSATSAASQPGSSAMPVASSSASSPSTTSANSTSTTTTTAAKMQEVPKQTTPVATNVTAVPPSASSNKRQN